MARLINLTTPEIGVTNGMELSFYAPCDCNEATGISLEDKTYAIVDASGAALTSCSNYFIKGAVLSVIIDTVNEKAYLLNPTVNTYTNSLGVPTDEPSATATTVWARVKHLESNTYTKDEISNLLGLHVTEIANLIGGEAL